MTKFVPGIAILVLAAGLRGQTKAELDKLPIKRVVLYKNGVGYFEHLGAVRGTRTLRFLLHRDN
jgi:hypothetical protein